MSVEIKPVFVCGNSRSGTTVLAKSLSMLDGTFMFDELHYYDELASKKKRYDKRSIMDCLYSRYKSGYFGSRTQPVTCPWVGLNGGENPLKVMFDQVSAELHCPILIEQTPANVRFIPEILATFPDARIIVLVRDYRDVLLSQKSKWKRKFRGGAKTPWLETIRAFVNYNPILIALIWKKNYQKIPSSESVLCLRYEDLITDPKKQLSLVCTFLNEPFDPVILDVAFVGSSLSNDSSSRGFSSTNTGNWKKSLPYLDCVIADTLCGNIAADFGYDRQNHSFFSCLVAFVSRALGVLLRLPFLVFLNRHRLRAQLRYLR